MFTKFMWSPCLYNTYCKSSRFRDKIKSSRVAWMLWFFWSIWHVFYHTSHPPFLKVSEYYLKPPNIVLLHICPSNVWIVEFSLVDLLDGEIKSHKTNNEFMFALVQKAITTEKKPQQNIYNSNRSGGYATLIRSISLLFFYFSDAQNSNIVQQFCCFQLNPNWKRFIGYVNSFLIVQSIRISTWFWGFGNALTG